MPHRLGARQRHRARGSHRRPSLSPDTRRPGQHRSDPRIQDLLSTKRRGKPGVENMLGTCAAAFNRKRSGHARRPPGRKKPVNSQARFSRLGASQRETRLSSFLPAHKVSPTGVMPAASGRHLVAALGAVGLKYSTKCFPTKSTSSVKQTRAGHRAGSHQRPECPRPLH